MFNTDAFLTKLIWQVLIEGYFNATFVCGEVPGSILSADFFAEDFLPSPMYAFIANTTSFV